MPNERSEAAFYPLHVSLWVHEINPPAPPNGLGPILEKIGQLYLFLNIERSYIYPINL